MKEYKGLSLFVTSLISPRTMLGILMIAAQYTPMCCSFEHIMVSNVVKPCWHTSYVCLWFCDSKLQCAVLLTASVSNKLSQGSRSYIIK